MSSHRVAAAPRTGGATAAGEPPALVLLGHGSRDPRWREPMDRVAERVRARQPGRHVQCAFLELCGPTLDDACAQAVAAGAAQVVVLPMLLGAGHHVRAQLPELLALIRSRHPHAVFDLRPPLGDTTEILDALAALASKFGHNEFDS